MSDAALRPAIRLGVLYPGSMGSSLARVAISEGAEVYTHVADRSERTQGFARDAGIHLLDSEVALLQTAEVIFSVLRPDKALETAQRVANSSGQLHPSAIKTRYYLSLDAVSPRTAEAIAEAFASTSITVIDGGIIGGPARLSPHYMPLIPLSGPDASNVVSMLAPLYGADRVKNVGPRVGQASAFKMAYASLTKGFLGIVTNSLTFAARMDVLDSLLEEVRASQPGMAAQAEKLPPNLSKSFRWVGEMEEIGASFGDVGLGGGQTIFEGMAATYAAVEKTPFGEETVEQAAERKRDLPQAIALLAESLGRAS